MPTHAQIRTSHTYTSDTQFGLGAPQLGRRLVRSLLRTVQLLRGGQRRAAERCLRVRKLCDFKTQLAVYFHDTHKQTHKCA